MLPQKDKSLCDMINTVLPNQWPETLSPEHGEYELKALCQRFLVTFSGELKTAGLFCGAGYETYFYCPSAQPNMRGDLVG